MNPFPYSLVNYSSCLACKEVTLDDTTYFEWTGEFETDVEVSTQPCMQCM